MYIFITEMCDYSVVYNILFSPFLTCKDVEQLKKIATFSFKTMQIII